MAGISVELQALSFLRSFLIAATVPFLPILPSLVGARERAHADESVSVIPQLDLGSFSIATLLFALLFGVVGFAAFRRGKKNGEPRQLFLGIALMSYGYFVSNAWVSLGIGALLTLLLFYPG